MRIVILGLSVTSSWGNGHATTYRSLIRGLAARGHQVTFLERDTEWYAGNRDEPNPAGAETHIYQSVDEVITRFEGALANADFIIVGSFVPEGVKVAEWATAVAKSATAFYDIDTPITLASLENGSCEYLTPALIPKFGMYLSFTGGPMLRCIENRWGAPMARALYCSVDPQQYSPLALPDRWDLGYLGTYSSDRQPLVDELLLRPAVNWPEGRFAVAGPMYPDAIGWPANVWREIHLSPREHAAFYASQRFTLNVTRAAMKQAGYSPSVRLFEAGACGAPVISDWWEGLDSLLEIEREVLVATQADDVLRFLRDLPDNERRTIGARARARILGSHTPEQRAIELESCWKEWHDNVAPHPPRPNRRERKEHHGPGEGLASERGGQTAGGADGREAEANSNPGGLHQPAGARR
jgi:spore maturation protein CgeB